MMANIEKRDKPNGNGHSVEEPPPNEPRKDEPHKGGLIVDFELPAANPSEQPEK